MPQTGFVAGGALIDWEATTPLNRAGCKCISKQPIMCTSLPTLSERLLLACNAEDLIQRP